MTVIKTVVLLRLGTMKVLTFWQSPQLFRPEGKHQREKVTQADSRSPCSRHTAVGAATKSGKHKLEVCSSTAECHPNLSQHCLLHRGKKSLGLGSIPLH